jgi:[acyl-carrier-protein] S-malonyltransferase
MRRLCWETDEETLRLTENAQLALFTCSMAAWAALREKAPDGCTAVAGHSVGEYAALVAAGILLIEEGAELVRVRGELMARAGQAAAGTMAAVLGLDRDQLDQACEAADGIVVTANDNCPGQLVISGEPHAVQRAGEIAVSLGAKRVIPLNVSGAFHSPLMAVPAEEMAKALAGFSPREGRIKVYSNVTSEPVIDGYEWPGLLELQLKSPVRWTESVQHMLRDGVTTFVECGAGEVLTGLIRRIDKSARTLQVNSPESLESTLAALLTP